MQDALNQQVPVLAQMHGSGREAATSQSHLPNLCCFHQQLERYVTSRFSITVMSGPLNCTSFLKGLRNFDNWKLDTKNSLMNDLFVLKNQETTNQQDLLLRVNQFAINQVNQVPAPDIMDLISSL